tara:strand:+ start:5671 stop:8487 length:2817 start_codon:yes stop_codon:yes gene_type:complete
MKKTVFLGFALVALVAMLTVSPADAGKRDRNSSIELWGEQTNPGDYIKIPELSVAPTGNPAVDDRGRDNGWIYVIDSGGTMTLFFEDNVGSATNLLTVGSTAWDDIGDPDANSSIDFTTYTNTWDFGGTVDMFTVEFTGAFADVSGMVLEQKTGNPTDGTLLELILADTDVDFLSLDQGGEVYNIDSSGNHTGGAVSFTTTDWTLSADGRLTLAPDDSPASAILLSPSASVAYGIDASDTDITNALYAGTNAILGTTGAFVYDNWSISVAGVFDHGDNDINNVGNITADGVEADGTTLTLVSTGGENLTMGNSTGDVTVVSDNVTFTVTDAIDDVYQINGSGGAALLDIDLGAADAIALGDNSTTIALDSSDWDISATGAMTGIGAITSDGAIATTSTFDVDGNANISDTTAGADVTMGNSTGNIAVLSDNADFTLTDTTDNVFQLVNSAGSVVLFDVDLGATDAITIGSGAQNVVVASNNWDVDSAGAFTGVTAMTITNGGAGLVVGEQVDINADANDELLTYDNSAADLAASGSQVTFTNGAGAGQTNSSHVLALHTTADADAEDGFLICRDNSGADAKLSVQSGGETYFLPDAAVSVNIMQDDGVAGTDRAAAGGSLIINTKTITTSAGAATFKITAKAGGGGSEVLSGVIVQVDDDTDAAGEIHAINIDTADNTGSSETSGIYYDGGLDYFMKLEGTTDDGNEILIVTGDPGADVTQTIPAVAGAYVLSTAGVEGTANAFWGGTNAIVFEGATADAFELVVQPDNPTTDNTITLPDYAGGLPLVINQDFTQTDATGVGANTVVTGSSLTIADGWFAANKALKWTIGGTSDGSGGAAMTCALDVDGSQFGVVELTTGQSDDWIAEFTLYEHTAFANQKIIGVLHAEDENGTVEYDNDTTDFNDGGATTVRCECDTNHAADHIYVEFVTIEHWNQS